MAFTTRDGLQLWRLADIDAGVTARILEISPAEAEKHLAQVKARGDDREAHARLFGELSVPALVVLALLVDSGGLLDEDTLRRAAHHRFGLGEHEVSVGVLQAACAVLVVKLRATTHNMVALVDAAPAVAHLVRDLDLPRVPAGATVEPAPDHDGGRAMLAACLALGQFEIKVTQTGAPHRGGTRRLAKQLGADENQLERWLMLGISLGLVRTEDDDVLRPVPAAVAAAARGEFPHHPIVDAFVRRLREAGAPVPVASVLSWMTDVLECSPGRMETPQHLAQLPGVRAGKAGDIAVLEAVAPAPASGQAAASITPSFEVFLPPESRLDHVVDVLGAAELVRIDRVLVARITRASIQRALAHLDSADRIVAALAAASRTPVPQNVAAAIRDWADGTIRATVAVGRVIVVPAAEHERVLRALAAVNPVALAPGVVVVDADVPARIVAGVLAKAGINERRAAGDADPNARDANAARDAKRTRDKLTALRPLVAGDPALRDRVTAYRAGDRAERARVAQYVQAQAQAQAEEDERIVEGGGLEISPAAFERVERWERQHGALDDEDYSMLAALLDAVAPPDQAYLLAASKPEILRSRILEVLVQRGGLAAFVARHRRLVEGVVPKELLAMIEDSTASSPPPATALDWDRMNVVARVVAAERTQSTLVLDLGKGQIQTVKILQLLPRGRELMLLGEDVDDQSRVAVSLASVLGVAEPPPSPGPAPSPAAEARVWRPLSGQSPPAGHAPCPCGSGLKYRACCRLALPANRPS